MTNLLSRLLRLRLAFAFVLLASSAMAQHAPQCGYTQADSTWQQVSKCVSIGAGVQMLTDLNIQDGDTIKIRHTVNPVAGRFMWSQVIWVPTNPECSPVTVKKRMRCL